MEWGLFPSRWVLHSIVHQPLTWKGEAAVSAPFICHVKCWARMIKWYTCPFGKERVGDTQHTSLVMVESWREHVMWWPCPGCKSVPLATPFLSYPSCPLLSVVHLCPLEGSLLNCYPPWPTNRNLRILGSSSSSRTTAWFWSPLPAWTSLETQELLQGPHCQRPLNLGSFFHWQCNSLKLRNLQSLLLNNSMIRSLAKVFSHIEFFKTSVSLLLH